MLAAFSLMATRVQMGRRISPEAISTILTASSWGKRPWKGMPGRWEATLIARTEATTRSVRISIPPKHRRIFDFIAQHPDIFPGFFQLDIREKILPKLRMLQDFGFYAAEPEEVGTDSCGAHSPRVVAQTGGTAAVQV